MGRRNSCLVIEGSREDIARLTGFGLQIKQGTAYKIGEYASRLASWALLIFIFIAVPNGSTWDQVGFICLNLLGQLNNFLGTFLNSSRCFASLTKTLECPVATRTHVYGFMLRRFGDGPWIDEVKLLPGTSTWRDWKQEILKSDLDAKTVYNQCLKRKTEKRGEYIAEKDSASRD